MNSFSIYDYDFFLSTKPLEKSPSCFFCKKKLSYQQQDEGQITNILLLVYFSKYFSPNKFEFAIGFPWGGKKE
jgi:hypothetical protein